MGILKVFLCHQIKNLTGSFNFWGKEKERETEDKVTICWDQMFLKKTV